MSLMECVTVAKKKSPPPAPARKPMAAQFRGSEEFKAWMEELARKESLPTSSLIERALKLYAKSVGFDVPPPQR